MSYRKILVPVEAGDDARDAVETAFALASVFGAHVEGLHVRVEPTDAVPYVGEGMSGALVQELVELTERESVARAAAAQEMFEHLRLAANLPIIEAPAAGGASACWLEEVGREADAVVRAGRLADLIVIGRSGGEAIGGTPLFASVLFETGRPILVAGSGGSGSGAPFGGVGGPRRIVVAWKQSAEAARAVTAALPLLARAQRVTAVTARDDDERGSGLDALANYLAWHGIVADRRLLAAYPSVGEALTAAAVEADLVVMGGYSHSRLRELILGGVTRHMLEKTALPLLLAH